MLEEAYECKMLRITFRNEQSFNFNTDAQKSCT